MWFLLAMIGLQGVARADTFEESLVQARESIRAGDYRTAAKHLAVAEKAAPGSEQVVPSTLLATLWYYQGVVDHKTGYKQGPMDAWRQALVIDVEFDWDIDVLDEGDPQSLFEALRSEVRGRARVDPVVPEATGLAEVFVDGRQLFHGDDVFEGQHLAQISCPDEQVFGIWTDFRRPVRWFKMCPGGVDVSQVADEGGS
ncbi:MAG: hypothetical protein QGG40_19010, partial [Myxococcota bacterium]|nr:hypothetical protein [Myxococcota bacterium]